MSWSTEAGRNADRNARYRDKQREQQAEKKRAADAADEGPSAPVGMGGFIDEATAFEEACWNDVNAAIKAGLWSRDPMPSIEYLGNTSSWLGIDRSSYPGRISEKPREQKVPGLDGQDMLLLRAALEEYVHSASEKGENTDNYFDHAEASNIAHRGRVIYRTLFGVDMED